MAFGGDRVIANLPPTFAALPRPTALSALIDAFGGELVGAENSLSAMMFAHWVDYADKDSPTLSDLSAIAALYGLAPRDDETIERFRAHLKRYVLTFIDGTVTVRGIFRITAEALGLIIADDDAQLDTWWNRSPSRLLTTIEPSGDDAATALFGIGSALVRGFPPQAAAFLGNVNLSQPVDLRGRSLLGLSADGAAPATFDLAPHLPDPAAANLGAILSALAAAPGIVAAAHNGNLLIRSASVGAASSLELGDLVGDAVPAILGIAPHEYVGAEARRTQISGAVDLPSTIDMSSRRYLRLTIDGTASYEIDCAGPHPPATTPAEVVAAIQGEAGPHVASLAGQRLVLSSPTLGLSGTIFLQTPTTGDATTLLLGDATPYARGADAVPARAVGLVDLSGGIDLSRRSNLALAIDAIPPMVINCAGPMPQKTLAGDIATAINAAVGLPVATQNGAAVTLTSRVVGSGGRIRFLTAPSGDALDLIFGFTSRRATGADATSARFTGSADLTLGADLRAVQRVQIALDDSAPTIVDFAATGLAKANVATTDLVVVINAQLGATVASTDGSHLSVSSAAPGDQGSVAILPIETTSVRPFVSRAFPTDEASNRVLGVFVAKAQGAGASSGSLAGSVDLHDGLDLRVTRYLRLALDGGPPRDVDCASQDLRPRPRPRAVLVQQVADAINLAFGLPTFASVATGRLVLTSPTTGQASAVAAISGAGDASGTIFGPGPSVVIGTAAQRVVFTGLVDISQRVDLSAADRVRLAIDGRPEVEIQCGGGDPAHTSAAEIAGLINAALGGSYASTDGRFVRLASAVAGSAGEISFLVPSERDATRRIFGINPGRTYRGDDATSATLVSAHDLPPTLDLSVAPFVRLGLDAGAPVLVDCRGADPKNTTPTEIAARIIAAFPSPAPLTADFRNARIVVTSASVGVASRIALQTAGDGDASAVLLGNAIASAGIDATPATLIGTVDLRTGVDLSQRSVLRLAIDDNRPVDIDVSGAAPDRTFGDEIAAALNAVRPGLAGVNGNGQLVLTSPTRGETSKIEVLPLRPIEVIEYPPLSVTETLQTLKNGDRFALVNQGAAESYVRFALSSPGGFCGVDLIGLTTGYRIHVGAIVEPGKTLAISAANEGRVAASLADATGVSVPVTPDQATATPVALSVLVPFAGARPFGAGEPGTRPALALVDPLAGNVVLLEALASTSQPYPQVRVSQANPAEASTPPSAPDGRLELLGRLHAQGNTGQLLDAANAPIARVRASAGVTFGPFDGLMVVAEGQWYPSGSNPLLAVDTLARIFDVEINGAAYNAVAMDPRAGARRLASRLAAGGGVRVIARDVLPSDALRLPRGRSDWLLLRSDNSRFDTAHFDIDHFAGDPRDVAGIFGVSRFDAESDETQPSSAVVDERARFAPLPDDSTVTLTATWESHQSGAFTVNLPTDLPDQFGARFNAARFASQDQTSETYAGIVFEPPDDDHYLPKLLPTGPGGSSLVYATPVTVVPLGWEPQIVPFAQPRTRYLSGGRATTPSAIYLQEPGVPGAIGIIAKENGAWADEIAITVRFAGPAMFDLTVSYPGARFESARAIAFAGRVLGSGEDPLPALVAQIIKPGPIGVVQAKSAGIATSVTRDRT